MQKEIEKIEIVFENCEMAEIDGKYIGNFQMEDIIYSINRTAINCIEECYTCKHFAMGLSRKCNTTKKKSKHPLEADNPLDRINKYNDITSIYIYFSNQKEPKQILVKWNKENSQENRYQKTYVNQYGDMFIVISKKKEIEDYFDLNDIDDEDSLSFMWDYMNIN